MNNNKHWVSLSKSGIPCLWESGGSATNTGETQVIAGADGAPKKPIYVQTKGHLSCGQHALIPVEAGDYVIKAEHHRRDFEIRIEKKLDLFRHLNNSKYEDIKLNYDLLRLKLKTFLKDKLIFGSIEICPNVYTSFIQYITI